MNLSFKQYINEAKVVGKVIGGDRYLHKSYEHLLPHDELSAAKKHLPMDHFLLFIVMTLIQIQNQQLGMQSRFMLTDTLR